VKAQHPSSTIPQRFGKGLLAASTTLYLATTVFFLGLWDQVAAITTFPQWSWALIGVLMTAISWRLLGRTAKGPRWLLLLWFATILAFADNLGPVIRGLIRGSTPGTSVPDGTLRIVTLNCASSSAAAAEVTQFKPDIVLLQESPTSNEVARLARSWFGDSAAFVAGYDCAIVARFPLHASEARPPVHYTRAVVSIPAQAAKQELLVTSLRFTPPLGSMDLWNPATWRAYLRDRRLRKQQLRTVLDAVSSRTDLPEILGGDFNAPANDGLYRLLSGFQDTHRSAGRGWGNTALNTLPFFRPDQIWVRGLSPTAAYAIRTVHSDHRMVVADVQVVAR
jgi:endonuclease/exonuclease/phosphatase (EEP) superfamily protein YafD